MANRKNKSEVCEDKIKENRVVRGAWEEERRNETWDLY